MHKNQKVESIFDDVHVVSVYTRQNAIDDGVLIDVTEHAKASGFKIPVAMTSALWADCVEWFDDDTRKQRVGQDQEARLFDVLFMAAMSVKSARDKQCVPARVYRVKRDGRSQESTMMTFKLHVGPGDTAAPVITLMLMNES